MFGLFCRSPAWVVGLATALIVLLAAILESWALGFELVMFAWLAGLVAFGGTVGRWAAHYLRNKIGNEV
jgi:hypothetical protein